jgi:hypothetical protein
MRAPRASPGGRLDAQLGALISGRALSTLQPSTRCDYVEAIRSGRFIILASLRQRELSRRSLPYGIQAKTTAKGRVPGSPFRTNRRLRRFRSRVGGSRLGPIEEWVCLPFARSKPVRGPALRLGQGQPPKHQWPWSSRERFCRLSHQQRQPRRTVRSRCKSPRGCSAPAKSSHPGPKPSAFPQCLGRILAKDTHRVDAAIASTWMKCLLARATRRAWR